MHTIQILLPLYNPEGEAFDKQYFNQIKTQLTERFGGITVYTRAPALGFWKESEEKTVRDEIIIFEIMADELEKDWWQYYREMLEKLFRQDEIIIRSWKIELL
jgi:hypothetical protein